jgi:hypothetical protein
MEQLSLIPLPTQEGQENRATTISNRPGKLDWVYRRRTEQLGCRRGVTPVQMLEKNPTWFSLQPAPFLSQFRYSWGEVEEFSNQTDFYSPNSQLLRFLFPLPILLEELSPSEDFLKPQI